MNFNKYLINEIKILTAQMATANADHCILEKLYEKTQSLLNEKMVENQKLKCAKQISEYEQHQSAHFFNGHSCWVS